MNPVRVARSERRRAEQALESHLKICLGCYRWAKNGSAGHCDLGPKLASYVELMHAQEAELSGGGWEQGELW